MKFSLIICTYMRPTSLLSLLESIEEQTLYPDEIIIVDGSSDSKTKIVLNERDFLNLTYLKVSEKDRGLTKQRNIGISLTSEKTEVICFLDDDTILETDYFEQLIHTYKLKSDAMGVGGIAINENRWFLSQKIMNSFTYFRIGNYYRKESSRYLVRKLMGCYPSTPLGVMPNFSHGNSYSYPPDGNLYPVDLLIGMSFSFRKEVFKKIKFSEYFEGYGLYEDADFSLRAKRFGNNYINTKVKLSHYHALEGRPNKFKYGKMVIRNGWYVWRVKYAQPSFKSRFKWNCTALLLIIIRFSNIVTTNKRKEAFSESIGRVYGMLSLIFNKPVIEVN